MNEHTQIPVTLTQSAIAHVKHQIAKKGKGTALRLSTKTTGCSNWSYVVDIAEEPQEKDYIFPTEEGIFVYVDFNSYPLVKGTEIDYVRVGMKEKFEFKNPNVKNLCGCGASFQVHE